MEKGMPTPSSTVGKNGAAGGQEIRSVYRATTEADGVATRGNFMFPSCDTGGIRYRRHGAARSQLR